MELQATLSAVEKVTQKLSVYEINASGVYSIRIGRREVVMQCSYSPEFMKGVILANFEGFKQLPISKSGFIEIEFMVDGIAFQIVLT